ncbi:hypothetical protein [Arthrobacter sp. A5]
MASSVSRLANTRVRGVEAWLIRVMGTQEEVAALRAETGRAKP